MIPDASEKQIIDAYNNSINSYIAKSTRRIIFNFSTQNIEERGYYYAGQVGGFGAGLLIYKDSRYFLLTAKHNITKHLHAEEWRTESPIWVPAEYKPNISKDADNHEVLGSFFMSRRMWEIGAITANDHPEIDSQDIVLIEFSDNAVMFAMRKLPPVFFDFNDRENIIFEDEFFENQILTASGFPKATNKYIYDQTPGSDTIHVQHNIDHALGLYKGNGRVEFLRDPPITHDEFNGMSGGPVFSISEDDREIKLAGITVRGGNNNLHFLPAYMFIEAIENYREAPCTVLDPASDLTSEATERPDEVIKFACSLEEDEEACLRRHRLL